METLIIILFVIALILFIVAATLATLKHFRIIAPLYVQTTQLAQNNQKLLLTDSRHKFSELIKLLIDKLPMQSSDKSTLYQFVLKSDQTLKALFEGEKIPVMVSDIKFGALTVTFRLKLRELSRTNLDKLMKVGDLVAQALSVESVRLIQGAGYIDCEVSSPVRVNVDMRVLQAHTQGTAVSIGLDSTLKPATIDISQHGLIAAIAPSRRGKTQAIRTMLYLLKRANPDIQIVIVAFKSSDWQAFGNSAALILDKEEIAQFCQWITQEMYKRAKNPVDDRWVVVFDDLMNLLQVSPNIADTVKELASLGAGTGITTIVSTQFSGKDSGGTATFANATCRLMFKPSSNLQGARDGGMAGLGLDQLSTQKGDGLLVVDGDSKRICTAMTPDNLILSLQSENSDREWLQHVPTTTQTGTGAFLALHPMEQHIEKLNGWLLEENVFDWETGKFINRTEALRKLGWHNNTHYRTKLEELEAYIYAQHEE